MASISSNSPSDNLDDKHENLDGQAAASSMAVATRLRAAAKKKGIERAELNRRSGITKQSFAGYWNGDRVPPSELLFGLADILEIDPRELLFGRRAIKANPLLSADQADWVSIEEYDLRAINEEGKGEGKNPSPFRRDWLNQMLGTANRLWFARMLSDYAPANLPEGALVFCTDVTAAELEEGFLCFFRINGGIVVGRFSYRGAAGDRLGEVIVSAAEIGTDDNQYVPVARILGRLLGRV